MLSLYGHYRRASAQAASASSPRHLPLPQRSPLQELSISTWGDLVDSRRSCERPIPSPDQENLFEVVSSLDYQNLPSPQQETEAQRWAEGLEIYQEQLEDAIQEIAASLEVYADSPEAANPGTQPRLSMPLLDSDESDSEPDLSVLGRVRPGAAMEPQNMHPQGYEDEVMSQDSVEEAEDTSVEEQVEEHVDDAQDEESPVPLADPASLGLKEISNLGKFTVSSHKQGNGVDELRSDDLKQYWQSDGPQPHKLTVYFVKRVGIRDIRFYVDYNEDESYTPTKIVFRSGTSENNLMEFAMMSLESPVGWQQVPLDGVGGDPDGNTLVSWVLQMEILENHQNGKDTHLRGIKIYAFDGDVGGNTAEGKEDMTLTEQSRGKREMSEAARILAATRLDTVTEGFTIPDFMKERELR